MNQWDNGTFCTAQLTETQFMVVGSSPSTVGGATPIFSTQIPGFEFVKPESGKMAEGYVAPVEQTVSASQTSKPSRHGFLGKLFRH